MSRGRSARRYPVNLSKNGVIIRRRFVKRFALRYGTVVLSVSKVGVLWPNGWIDQDATWYEDRPWPRRRCVTWRSTSPPKKGAQPPQFSADVCCGETVAHLSNCWAVVNFLGGGMLFTEHTLIAHSPHRFSEWNQFSWMMWVCDASLAGRELGFSRCTYWSVVPGCAAATGRSLASLLWPAQRFCVSILSYVALVAASLRFPAFCQVCM